MRLHLKITLGIVLIFVAVGGVSVYTLLLFQRAAALEQFEAMAKTLSTTVLHSLMTTMVNNNPTEMQEIIRHIRREEMIHRVAIFAPDGRVWASSDAGELGQIQPSALLSQVIRSGVPLTEERPAARELVVLTPIPNQRECQACHAPGQTTLGVTAVSLGTEQVAAHLAGSGRLLGGLVGFTFLLALGTLSVLLGRFVLDPLAEIVRTVREVSRGNYQARAVVQTSDELGMLAAAFNDMSGRIEHFTAAQRARIEELTRRLATLSIFSRTLTEAGDITAALTEAAAALQEMVRGDTCIVYRLEGGQAAPAAAAGNAALASPWGSAVVARAVAAGTPAAWPGPSGQGAVAGLAVPLRTKERTVGAVLAVRSAGPALDAADTTLLTAVAGHLAAVMENRRLFLELRDKDRVRGELLSRLIRAHEDERTRIARELHDEVTQSLTGLMMRLSAAEATVPPDLTQVGSAVSDAHAVAEGTLEEVRRIIFDLRPSLLDDLGLIPAVRHYARTLLESQGVQVRVTAAGFGQRRLPAAAETTVFRVAQEAMTNVARHARATVVNITLEHADGLVHLTVTDNGVGFEPAVVLSDAGRRRLGIAGMEERVALLGGDLRIESAPGAGATVRMSLPVGDVDEGRTPDP